MCFGWRLSRSSSVRAVWACDSSYLLGANIGTLFDALLVALVLSTPVGVTTVLLILGLSAGLTVVALLLLDWYVWSITTVDDLLLEDRRAFVAFVVSLLLVPIILVVIPLVIR